MAEVPTTSDQEASIPSHTMPSGPHIYEALVGPNARRPMSIYKFITIVLLVLILGGVIAAAVLAGQARGNAGGGGASSDAIQAIQDQLEQLMESGSVPDVAAAAVNCDVLIVGYGPGGVNTAYRLAPKLGDKLCVVDERNHVGGKVLSVPVAQSTTANPLYTPTHAEQFRQGDVIARCLAQELGLPCEAFGSPLSHLEGIFRGVNFTGVSCFGNAPVTGPPSCSSGITLDRLAANGDLAGAYPNMQPACGDADWTECSYCDEYFAAIMDASNVNTIATGETMETYVRRIIGQSGLEFWVDTCGYPYPITAPADAKAYIEYLNYDFQYAYGLLLLPVGGPQQLFKRMDARIRANGTRVFLNEKISSVSYSTGKTAKTYRFTLKSASGNAYNAKRLVLAIPPLAVKALTGNVATRLQASSYVQYSGHNRACTWNGAWETRWWNPAHTTCNRGFCTTRGVSNGSFVIDANPLARNYSTWTFLSDLGISFAQYIGTTERQKENLLRIFFDDAECDPLNSLFTTGGAGAVTSEILRRLRAIFGGSTAVPDPLTGVFSYEEYAYQLTSPGACFTAKQLADYAANPLLDDSLCLVNEGFNMLDSGWEEAALVSSHNCFRGKVFQDIYQPGDVSKWERCSNRFTHRDLIKGNKNSETDLCLLLSNEYHARDLAGLNYCGGPTSIVSDVHESGDIVASSTEEDWAHATTIPIPGPERVRKQKNRYNIVDTMQ